MGGTAVEGGAVEAGREAAVAGVGVVVEEGAVGCFAADCFGSPIVSGSFAGPKANEGGGRPETGRMLLERPGCTRKGESPLP